MKKNRLIAGLILCIALTSILPVFGRRCIEFNYVIWDEYQDICFTRDGVQSMETKCKVDFFGYCVATCCGFEY